MGVQILINIQYFGSKFGSLLRKETNIGCAAAHPAHPFPPTLQGATQSKGFAIVRQGPPPRVLSLKNEDYCIEVDDLSFDGLG